jgi:predicted RNA-binding Zn-ribbon protein involved in translation (DUF1610 family)
VTDLERLFHHIVRNLAATNPARLRTPLTLEDIRTTIVPYRTSRRALELESSEDYELVLMRLCAGEGGLARTEPPEVRAEFEAEVESSNPDLGLVHKHEKAAVYLDDSAVALALDPKPDLAFAPPAYSAGLPEAPDLAPAASEADPGPARCTGCNGVLPPGRTVNFCPHCGHSQILTSCPVCQSDLEAGWRHCVSCGFLIGHR